MIECPSCGERANPEQAQFCLACGRPLLTPDQQEVRKLVTVVCCGVGGSTTLAERLDQETLRGVMSDYVAGMRRVLERHGAIVNEFIGDAVTAVFGLPQLREDDALRAVRAVAEVREGLASLDAEMRHDHGVPLAVRVGVDTGLAVTGIPVAGQPLVIGDVATVAARLERVARPGEILLGEGSYALVKDEVTVEPVPPLVVEGRQSPVRAVRLIAVDPPAVDPPARLGSAMVGRDREQNLLHEVFERAVRDRTCHLVTVLGPAGVGKSRLLYEFTSAARERAMVLRGRCLSYGDGITLWPMVETIRQAADLAKEDPAEVARSRILAALDAERHAELIANGVVAVLGLASEASAPEESFWAVRKLFEAVARRKPLVVVFDDLHWGEPTFVKFVEHLAEWTSDAPILLACIARPQLLERFPSWGGGKANATVMTLAPLTEAESKRLIANLVGEAALADIWKRIGEATGGNPLFLEQLLQKLIDDRVLRRDDGNWVAAGDLSRLVVPPSIQALLTARLEQLSPGERAAIDRAAVIGKVFYLGAVEELSLPDARHAVSDQLLGLVHKDLVRPFLSDFADEETFRFRHILIRDTAYAMLRTALRAELHERFAIWTERRAGTRVAEYEEIIGYHLARAYQCRLELGPVDRHVRRLGRRAAERLIRAGQRAFVRGDMPAAIKLLSRAGWILPEDDPTSLDLLTQLGEALTRVGQFERANDVLNEVISRATALDDQGLLAYAVIQRAFGRIATDSEGGARAALDDAKRAIELFDAVGDGRGLTKAWSLVSEVHQVQGHSAERQSALELALAYARSTGDEREEAWAVWGIVGAMAQGPTPAEEVVRFAEEQLEWAVKQRHRWLEAGTLMHLGEVQAMLGRFDAARELLGRARAICDDLGLKVLAAATSQIACFIEVLAGDLPSAERRLRRGYEVLETLGEKSYLSTAAAQLAETLCALGRYEEARVYATESEKAAASDDVVTQILWRRAKAKLLSHDGELAEAERLVREAVVLGEATDLLTIHADTLFDLAAVLRLAGRHEAPPVAEDAMRLYQQKGNLVAAERVRGWLREQQPQP
jgi:predicted ATPase/class 3 adenylate cyclase